ncbi:MAG: hypothetical protein J5621_06945 [Paludibacteraceae bacterium]|nr:hypothetical protein [Paludibacteraceae bacterium]
MKRRFTILLLTLSTVITLFAQNKHSDSIMLAAYLSEDMSVWREYVDDPTHLSPLTTDFLFYEYGFCGYMVDRDKAHALPYVKRYKQHVESLRQQLPAGHYEMYLSAAYVYELRLHESMHPLKAMNMAKDAAQKAPNDPLVLAYYGTSLFYAPKPFGSKQEALKCFEKAELLSRDRKWHDCWIRPNVMMYIAQCYAKTGNTSAAISWSQDILRDYPDYLYIRNTFLPALQAE